VITIAQKERRFCETCQDITECNRSGPNPYVLIPLLCLSAILAFIWVLSLINGGAIVAAVIFAPIWIGTGLYFYYAPKSEYACTVCLRTKTTPEPPEDWQPKSKRSQVDA
jgi:hypothetical protein